MAEKFSVGDTVALNGEITIVHDDGKVTARLRGYDFPVTVRAEHFSMIAKAAKRGKRPVKEDA